MNTLVLQPTSVHSARGDQGLAANGGREGRGTLANLDFLRAAAVLFVLGDHTMGALLALGPAQRAALVWLGRAGVLFFFFVHTCCVLMMSLERHQGSRRVIEFYTRRAFRIYPLSIVGVLIVMAFGLGPSLNAAALLSNLALVQNLTFQPNAFRIMWSLPLEVQMYVFLPFLFVLVSRYPRLWVLLATFAVSVPIALWQPHHVERASVLSFAPDFIPGAIAYWLYRLRLARLPGWLLPIVLALYISAFLLHPGWGFPAWTLCLAVGLTLPLFRQIRSSRVNAATFEVAKYSYGIYISHALLLLCIKLTWATLPVYLGLVALCSVSAYHLVEHPMIKLGYRATQSRRLFPRPV